MKADNQTVRQQMQSTWAKFCSCKESNHLSEKPIETVENYSWSYDVIKFYLNLGHLKCVKLL
jgi:hypothetical protein